MHADDTASRAPNSSGLLLLFLLVFLLLACKSPDALSTPQFWAEDGVIFFTQQFGHALPRLLTSYAGYLHTVPRLVAWLAAAFPYRDAPGIYNFCAIVIDSSAVLYFALRSRWLVPIWLTLAIFALAPTDGEAFGTLTNVQWFLQFALFAMALYPNPPASRSTARRWSRWVAAALLALTGPFSILIILIVAALFFLTRLQQWYLSLRWPSFDTWWAQLDKPTVAIITVGALVQGVVLAFIGSRVSSPFDPVLGRHLILLGFQMHTFGNTLFKEKIAALVFALLLIALFKLTRRIERPILPILLAILVLGMAQIVSTAHPVPRVTALYMGLLEDRYFLFAKIGFWFCVACALPLCRGMGKPTARMLVPLLLVLIAICHPEMMRRRPLPDLHWKQAVKVLEHAHANAPVTIPINPRPWKITLVPTRTQ